MNIISCIRKAGKAVWRVGKKNAPTLMVIAAGLGTVAAIVTAVKATPACNEELEREGLGDPEVRKEHILDCAKIYAKHYWKTAAFAAGGIGMGFMSDHAHKGREAAIAAGGQIAALSLQGLEQAIKEEDGEKQLEKYRTRAVQDDIKAIESHIRPQSNGDAPIKDSLTGQFTPLTQAEIIKEAHNMWKALQEGDFIELNYWLGCLKEQPVPYGDTDGIGFGSDSAYETGDFPDFNVEFVPGETANGELCWEIVYSVQPEYRWKSKYSFH